MPVNWCEITITREDNGRRLYKNTFITHHQLTPDNVVPIMRDGRARWKSKNETDLASIVKQALRHASGA